MEGSRGVCNEGSTEVEAVGGADGRQCGGSGRGTQFAPCCLPLCLLPTAFGSHPFPPSPLHVTSALHSLSSLPPSLPPTEVSPLHLPLHHPLTYGAEASQGRDWVWQGLKPAGEEWQGVGSRCNSSFNPGLGLELEPQQLPALHCLILNFKTSYFSSLPPLMGKNQSFNQVNTVLSLKSLKLSTVYLVYCTWKAILKLFFH